MSSEPHPIRVEHEAAQIRSLAAPLTRVSDLDGLVDTVGDARFVCLGEASHGTHEFYRWRVALSRRLITKKRFTWIGVEGDWPDCWRINRWVQGNENQDLSAGELLAGFERWPTWMWANREVAEVRVGARRVLRTRRLLPVALLEDSHLLDRGTRTRRPTVGDDGLAVLRPLWRGPAPLRAGHPTRAGVVREGCGFPAGRGPAPYPGPRRRRRRWVRRRTERRGRRRGRALLPSHGPRRRGIMEHPRPPHGDTIDRIAQRMGPRSKALVWEHNTHVGDARATDMATAGLVTVGQLVRERHSGEGVALVGFAAHRGTVLAAQGWGQPEHVFYVPSARSGSHEGLLHAALGRPAVLTFGADRSGSWLTTRRGHRAIGVVYDPRRESGNYVPTVVGGRYDALIWFEETTALHPLRHELPPRGPELETEPLGY